VSKFQSHNLNFSKNVESVTIIPAFIGNNKQFFGFSEINMTMGDTRLILINTIDYSQINLLFETNQYLNNVKL
jgi:hypothetical protein